VPPKNDALFALEAVPVRLPVNNAAVTLAALAEPVIETFPPNVDVVLVMTTLVVVFPTYIPVVLIVETVVALDTSKEAALTVMLELNTWVLVHEYCADVLTPDTVDQ
jgi:hypothetical protein